MIRASRAARCCCAASRADSKTDLYQAALDRFCAVLSDHVAEPVGGFTDASIDGLLKAAIAGPDGFRLLFVHAAREPEFKALADRFRSDGHWHRPGPT